MINFMSNLAVFGINDIPGSEATDTLNELDYKVNDNVTVVSSYYGTISRKDGKYIEAQTSMNVKDGDLLVMISTGIKGSPHEIPNKFHEIISAGDRKVSMSVAMKMWHKDDPMEYLIERKSKHLYTSLITLRGVKDVRDVKLNFNKLEPDSVTPRVKTEDGGALISAFSFAGERNMSIMTQQNLVSLADSNGGLSARVCSCDGNLAKKISAVGRGISSSDIALALSLI